MTVGQILDTLRQTPEFRDNVTHWQVLPARPAQYVDFPSHLHPRLIAAVKQMGISQLYSHQGAALQALAAGRHVAVVTPTASGKTLCYNLPVLNTVLCQPEARALYLFPTKALSQDQVAELHDLVTILGAEIKTYTFDGDTPASARQAIRTSGHIVVTNPDMLHQGILPHHTKWLRLFENLRYVVIDEIHNYRGVFGSHLANVIRRLKRVCRFYGSNPQFVCCSATVANPKELAERLVEEQVELVDNNGAPRGEKHFILYNPPVVNRELGIRRSSVREAQRIARYFLAGDVQTILFARSRLRVEILLSYLKETMRQLHKPEGLVRGYRGGYLPSERREIERGLRSGEILGVVSTNALELGIDIGQLDACIMVGYPGTIASTWQQAGRAGRRRDASVAILVASSAPLDQYIVNHPEYFFGQPPEAGIIDPNNLLVLMSHVKCAAFELPFEEHEQFGVETTGKILEYLEQNQVLHRSEGKYHWASDIYPAEEVSLRSASTGNFVIIDTTVKGRERVIGEVDQFSAPMLVHEGAIYMHESRQYHVDTLDWERRKAYVHEVAVDHYTDAEEKTHIKVLEVEAQEAVPGGHKALGEVSVTTIPTIYKKIKFGTHENVGWGKISLPELEMHTTAYWWEIAPEELAALGFDQATLADALKAVANVLANVAPVFALCDPRDLHAVPMVRSPFSELPTVYLYESHPGGVGLSRRLFHLHVDLLAAARDLIARCPCSAGCPSCVGPPLEVGKAGKNEALRLLEKGIAK